MPGYSNYSVTGKLVEYLTKIFAILGLLYLLSFQNLVIQYAFFTFSERISLLAPPHNATALLCLLPLILKTHLPTQPYKIKT